MIKEIGPLFADPLLFCDALVAFEKHFKYLKVVNEKDHQEHQEQEEGKELQESTSSIHDAITDVYLPRIIQQIIPQLTKCGPSVVCLISQNILSSVFLLLLLFVSCALIQRY